MIGWPQHRIGSASLGMQSHGLSVRLQPANKKRLEERSAEQVQQEILERSRMVEPRQGRLSEEILRLQYGRLGPGVRIRGGAWGKSPGPPNATAQLHQRDPRHAARRRER